MFLLCVVVVRFLFSSSIILALSLSWKLQSSFRDHISYLKWCNKMHVFPFPSVVYVSTLQNHILFSWGLPPTGCLFLVWWSKWTASKISHPAPKALTTTHTSTPEKVKPLHLRIDQLFPWRYYFIIPTNLFSVSEDKVGIQRFINVEACIDGFIHVTFRNAVHCKPLK